MQRLDSYPQIYGTSSQDSTSVQAESRPARPVEVIKEVITYSKATQTQSETAAIELHNQANEESQEQLIARLRAEIEAETRIKETEEETATANIEAPIVQVPNLSDIEKEELLKSAELSQFLGRSSKVLERALYDEFDILVDYTRDVETDRLEASKGSLQEIVRFSGERTKRRMVTSIDWSPRYNELLLASYSKDRTNANEEQGLIHVWNSRLPQRPEFTFGCQSEVQHAIFSPHNPTYVIGGSYSGQILLWDTRAKGQPVLHSPLAGKGHTYPITGLNLIGTKQANSIVSTSSDGTVCTWSIDMLAQPQEVIELALLPPSKVEEVAPTAVSHSPSDASAFLVGTEDGNMYSVNRLDKAGAKAGIDPKIVYKGHAAMITGVKHHTSRGPVDLSDLVLTSSLDWTVRLWRLKAQGTIPIGIHGQSAAVQSPLMEFQKEDMVYDVQWSPTRPGVFASVDGTGECHVYDLCQSHEIPIAKGAPAGQGGASGTGTPRALNKVVWDHDEGRRLAVAGVDGVLTVLEVPDALGGKEPSADQYAKLNARLKFVGR